MKNCVTAKSYSPGRKDTDLLPLFLYEKEKEGEEKSVEQLEKIDRKTRDMWDQRAIVEWNFEEWGLPTVVSPARIILQPTEEDPLKDRYVNDERYVNANIDRKPMSLPRHISIAKESKVGDLGTKEDMKAGYLQMELEESDMHTVALEWRAPASD